MSVPLTKHWVHRQSRLLTNYLFWPLSLCPEALALKGLLHSAGRSRLSIPFPVPANPDDPSLNMRRRPFRSSMSRLTPIQYSRVPSLARRGSARLRN